jgi:uncharacterized protein (DUF1778 family)
MTATLHVLEFIHVDYVLPRPAKRETLNLRINRRSAASSTVRRSLPAKNRTDFVLKQRRTAEDTLLDRTVHRDA